MHIMGGVRISSLVFLVVSVRPALGGFISIRQLTPFDDGHRTPRISGLAFDGQPNPWIIDGLSWQMQRLNALNGSVLETYSPQPDPHYNDSLAWSAQTGSFYTANQFYLYSIGLGSRVVVGPFPLFNFTSLAFDSAGNLWLGVDHNSVPELWRVNTSTAQLSFVTGIEIAAQLTALAIDSQGGFYVSAYDGPAKTSSIYGVNPDTGAATFITTATTSAVTGFPSLIVDFERQPHSGRWFAVEEQRSGSGYSFYFGEITGIVDNNVPEPACFAIVALVLLLIMTRTRSAMAAHSSSETVAAASGPSRTAG